MSAAELHRVVDALASVRCSCWLTGGWGVDALVGSQTRTHRDVDLAFDARLEGPALAALGQLGYRVDTDWRPVRVELAAPAGRFVDLHPVVLEPDGTGVQAGLDGARFVYPASEITGGTVAGRSVPCISVALQLQFHRGYEPRDQDRADLALLQGLARSRDAG